MAIEVRPLDPASASAVRLITALDRYLLDLYPVESNHLDPVEELSRPHVSFLGAFEAERPLGCGAVKLPDNEYGELKRIYVEAEARGRGVGRQLLMSLERVAIQSGCVLLRLETGVYQPAALQLFAGNGYIRTQRFGSYPDDPLSVFMEKSLVRAAADAG